jgi:hypothetical protein
VSKSVFIPVTSSREQDRRLYRFEQTIDESLNLHCACGASYPWIEWISSTGNSTLQKWVDEHARHMPALPTGWPELGNLLEQDDAGETISMRRALRWLDGRVEVVEQVIAPAAPQDSSGRLADADALWAQFHEAHFTDIWYAHPGRHPYEDYQPGGAREHFGPRWHAGVFTGPQHDLICVRSCATNDEAERYLSPGGWSPEEAVRLALHKLATLGDDHAS